MTAPAAVDGAAMRRAVGRFASGVTVITTVTPDGDAAGCTVSAFCSLSLDPPLVLVCLDRRGTVHRMITAAPGYAVNVLAADQRAVATAFARPGADRFRGVGTRPGRHGVPLLVGAVAHIECDRHAVAPGGDHDIVIGRVRHLSTRPGEPLLYVDGAFVEVAQPAWDDARADAQHEWLLSAPW